MVGTTVGDFAGSSNLLAGRRWAPLVPLVLAGSLGIVTDRYAEPWATTTWAALALGAGAAALVATSRDIVGNLAVVAAFWALGGGWHHYRWSDRGLDDLGESTTETPQPAWVRGVIREALGVRQDDPDRYGATIGRGIGDGRNGLLEDPVRRRPDGDERRPRLAAGLRPRDRDRLRRSRRRPRR